MKKEIKPWHETLNAGKEAFTEAEMLEEIRRERAELQESVRLELKKIEKSWLELERTRREGERLASKCPPGSERRLELEKTITELRESQEPLELLQEVALKMLA